MAQPQRVRLTITAELVAEAQASTAAASVVPAAQDGVPQAAVASTAAASVAAAQDGVPQAAVAVAGTTTVTLEAQQASDALLLLTVGVPSPQLAPEPAADELPGLRFFTADGLTCLACRKTFLSTEAMSYHLMSSKHVRRLQRAIERAQTAAQTGGDVRRSQPDAPPERDSTPEPATREPASETAVEAAEPVGGSQTAAQPPREHRRWGSKWWHGYPY